MKEELKELRNKFYKRAKICLVIEAIMMAMTIATVIIVSLFGIPEAILQIISSCVIFIIGFTVGFTIADVCVTIIRQNKIKRKEK